MRLGEALEGVKRIFIDTAPVIYFVEENPDFVDVVQVVIDKLITGEIERSSYLSSDVGRMSGSTNSKERYKIARRLR